MWDGVGVESKIESVGEVCETEWPNVLKVSDANAIRYVLTSHPLTYLTLHISLVTFFTHSISHITSSTCTNGKW